jgi:hypothetical protein
MAVPEFVCKGFVPLVSSIFGSRSEPGVGSERAHRLIQDVTTFIKEPSGRFA